MSGVGLGAMLILGGLLLIFLSQTPVNSDGFSWTKAKTSHGSVSILWHNDHSKVSVILKPKEGGHVVIQAPPRAIEELQRLTDPDRQSDDE